MKNLSNLSRDSKIAIAIIAVAGLIVSLFLVGFVYNLINAPDSRSTSSSSSSSDPGWSTDEVAYLDLMYEAQAEDGITGTGFANDEYAVIHGHTVCELLDTYYVEDIADSLARNNDGILYKVSNKTKAYGIVAASIHLCPEYAPEVYEWMN